MKKYIILLLLIPTVLAQNIEIAEVLYDPITTETGGEAILLHNPTSLPIDITNYAIKTESSVKDATLPNKILLPDQYFLLTDLNWTRDNESFPLSDYEEALTLTNTNAGIALLNANNEIIDAVGWGDPLQIDEGLFQGMPANPVVSGNSLRRISSTNNNANDFIETYPILKDEAKQEGNQIQLTAHVCSSTEITTLSMLDEDLMTTGIQIYPQPKQQKLIKVSSEVLGEPTAVTAYLIKNEQILSTINLEKNNTIYSGNLLVEFYNFPGNYTVKIQADSKIKEQTFEYLTLSAIELDTNNLNFELIQGKTTVLDGDSDINTNKTTIRNIGNTNLNLGITATNFVSSTSEISINNLNYSLNKFANEQPLTNQLQTSTLIFAPGESSLLPLSFRMSTPSSALEGDYSSTISVTGVIA